MSERNTEFILDGNVISSKDLNYEQLVALYVQFEKNNGRFPAHKDINKKNNLPVRDRTYKVLKKYNKTMKEFYKDVGYNDGFHTNNYGEKEYPIQLEKLKKICEEIGHAPHYLEISQKYKLKNSRWLIDNCNNPNVTDYNTFIEYELGLKPRYKMSKEMATSLILKIQSELYRPIIQDDFIKGNGEVSISVVKRIWGTFNNMKRDLGIPVVLENMSDRKTSPEEVEGYLIEVCKRVFKTEGRTVITESDLAKYGNGGVGFSTCKKHLGRIGSSIRKVVEDAGFELLKSGRGLNFVFDDGEKTFSQYEYRFSNFLRSKGLIYQEDYVRGIRYSKFIKKYSGYVDCDYVVTLDDRTIYVEVTGLLRDYKSWYYADKPINSKSKENYRLKLKQKEELLRSNSLEYYFIFPCDIDDGLEKWWDEIANKG